MLNNYSCRSPMENTSMFWKSGGNFNLEELSNPVLVGYNFTDNFNVDVAVGIFWNIQNNIHSVSLSEYTNQLLSKVIRLEDKSTGSLIFWRNKESKSYFPVKKINKKHSQVLLVFRKNPGKWNYGWSSVLKTCTAFIVGVFERMWCFDEVF